MPSVEVPFSALGPIAEAKTRSREGSDWWQTFASLLAGNAGILHQMVNVAKVALSLVVLAFSGSVLLCLLFGETFGLRDCATLLDLVLRGIQWARVTTGL